jgi:hypothetical protein
MTTEEFNNEQQMSEGAENISLQNNISISSSQETTISTITLPTFNETEIRKQKLGPSAFQFNYTNPPAAIFLDTMVCEHDLTAARERVKKNQESGASIKERLAAVKGKISAAKLTKCGTHSLGKSVLERVRYVSEEKKKMEEEKQQVIALSYRDIANKAIKIREKYNNDPVPMSVKQLRAVLIPL